MIKMLTVVFFLSISVLASAQDLSPVFGCSFLKNSERPRLEKNSKSDSTTQILNKELTNLSLGRNSECAFDAIVELGDDTTMQLLAARALSESQQDEAGYATDVLLLLQTRGKTFSKADEFEKIIRTFCRPASVVNFLQRHLQDLPFRSRLDVMSNLIRQRRLQGEYAYIIPVLMEKMFTENPDAYDSYLLKMKETPVEFTCFKSNNCP